MTRTSYARRYFEMTGVRSTNLASTNASKVSAFRIPYPNLNVQLTLVHQYQGKWDALDSARTVLNRQLDLFAERRNVLDHSGSHRACAGAVEHSFHPYLASANAASL